MEDTQTHDTGVIREKQADEVCDIYDIYGNRTGKTFVRGEPLSDGQYVMVVDVWDCQQQRRDSDTEALGPEKGPPRHLGNPQRLCAGRRKLAAGVHP